ncbi:MAG: IclR family transcriptional regulator [Shinella sp.]|uniref:IclR family transcriptional regulator n=1 Tax=Shinella sp. TaxID=1870904 RepID=UPI0040371900
MTERNPMRSMDRAFDIIEVLEDADAPLRLSEVARRAGLHPATAQRILTALKARGRVASDGLGYTVGLAAVIGINSFILTSRLVNEARPYMQVLNARTRLPVSLHIRLGFSRVIVERCGGDDTMQYNASIGRRLPLHLGAAKVIAAWMPEPQFSEFVTAVGDHQRADGKPVTTDELAAELRQIRERGFAVASQERIPGRFSVSAPIQTDLGVWDAALVISGRNLTDYDSSIAQMAADVREAAAEISARRLRPV